MVAQSEIDTFIRTVRTQTLAKGIKAQGRFVFGQDCAIVTGGVGFRGIGDRVNLVTGTGQPLADHFAVCHDHALDDLGLEVIVTDSSSNDLDTRGKVAGLLYRVGILLRSLDQSFAHLSGRESGGQKTLQHQLVKSTFVECFSEADIIRQEAVHLLDGPSGLDLTSYHDALTRVMTKAGKLMGGHGYLARGANGLEFLSLCAANQSAQLASLRLRADAA